MMIATATSSMNCAVLRPVMNGLISPPAARSREQNSTRGDRQHHHQRIEARTRENSTIARYIAMVIISPWAKLTTRTTPKITDRPSAISP